MRLLCRGILGIRMLEDPLRRRPPTAHHRPVCALRLDRGERRRMCGASAAPPPVPGPSQRPSRCSAAMQATGGMKRSRTRRKAFADEMKDMLKELTGQENLMLNGSDLFLVLDASGVVTYCSASAPSILFHAVEEMENQYLALYAPPSSRAVLASVLGQAQLTTANQPIHLRLWRPDGVLVHFEGVAASRSLSPICTRDQVTAQGVASKLAQMPPRSTAPPPEAAPPEGDYELPLVLWVAYETAAFPQAEAALQAAEQRLKQEDAREAMWVPRGAANGSRSSHDGTAPTRVGGGDGADPSGATVPNSPARGEESGASSGGQPAAVAPFEGIAPFTGVQLNTTAFFGPPRPRGWGSDHLAADMPLARVRGNLGEVKAAIAGLAGSSESKSSQTVFLEVDVDTLAICRAWGETKAVFGVQPVALARQRLESLLSDADLLLLVRKVIDPARQGGAPSSVAVTHRTAHGSQKVLVSACTPTGTARAASVHPDAVLHTERLVLVERTLAEQEAGDGKRVAPDPEQPAAGTQ